MMRRVLFVALAAAALAAAGCAHREKTAPCGPLSSLSWWFAACGPAVPIND